MKDINMESQIQEDYNEILARFYGFCDAVIRSILLRYEENGTRNVEIYLSARDSETAENEGWVSVRVVVRNVSEFGVRESPRTPIQVLSQGMHLLSVENQVGVEFGGEIEPPQSIESFRSSDGFAVGRDIKFHIGPY
jgi:hypothetical protein